jgi:hypothetical protein
LLKKSDAGLHSVPSYVFRHSKSENLTSSTRRALALWCQASRVAKIITAQPRQFSAERERGQHRPDRLLVSSGVRLNLLFFAEGGTKTADHLFTLG